MARKRLKHSYTIPCSSSFRDAISDLAGRRHVNVADLARSVALVVPDELIDSFPDPGGPGPKDRETVVLKSGTAKGRPWRRKPRLQVRMAPGYEVERIRRGLALGLAMERGEVKVRLEGKGEKDKAPQAPSGPPQTALISEAREELEKLRAIVSVLSFEPLSGGIRNRGDALHILGFPPASKPSIRALRARFRMLATVHHPDGKYGSHQRMSQLNAAMEHLIPRVMDIDSL
ncbi:MAG: J domain-containing protein [Rhodospirillales bacterium]